MSLEEQQLQMLRRMATLDPPPCFMGGYAEDALLSAHRLGSRERHQSGYEAWAVWTFDDDLLAARLESYLPHRSRKPSKLRGSRSRALTSLRAPAP